MGDGYVADAGRQDEGQADVGGPVRRVVHGQRSGQVGAQEPENGGWGDHKAAQGGVHSQNRLHPDGHVGVEAHQESGYQEHADVLDDEGSDAEEPQGQDGVLLAALHMKQQGKGDQGGRSQDQGDSDIARRSQALQAEHQADQTDAEQPDADVVDAGFTRLDMLAQENLDHDDDQQADGHVDGEDPVPAYLLDDEASQQGGDDGGDAPGRAVQADHARPLVQGIDVGQDRVGQRLDGAGPQALQKTGADQLGHGLGEGAQGGSDHEDQQSDGQQRLAAEAVRKLAVDGRGDRCHEQIDGVDPVHDGQPMQVPDDGGHGGGDDGPLDGRHEGGDEDRHRHQGAVGLPAAACIDCL